MICFQLWRFYGFRFAAFDMLDRDVLLSHLDQFVGLNWFHSYLSSRCLLLGQFSLGVPQGSVFWLILFFIVYASLFFFGKENDLSIVL